MRAAAGILVIACLAGACFGEPAARWGPLAVVRDEIGPDALATGVLVIDSRCVYLEAGAERRLLLWPEDRTTWEAGARKIWFAGRDGSRVPIEAGDRVALGGGEVVGPHDWVAEPDPSCAGPSWLVSDVLAGRFPPVGADRDTAP